MEIEKMIHSIRKIPPESISMVRRKIICPSGVRHEIDLWVEVKFGDGYDAIYIFEAKNWKRPVGKNEIVDFMEKMRVSGAQAGFFYAQSFTSCAEAQSKLRPNVNLVRIKVESQSPSSHLPIIETQESQIVAISINTTGDWRPLSKEFLSEIQAEEKNFSAQNFIRHGAESVVDSFLKTCEKNGRGIQENEFLLGSFDVEGPPLIWKNATIESIHLRIIIRSKSLPTSCSVSYDAPGRGRHIRLNDVRISDQKVLTNIRVTTDADSV